MLIRINNGDVEPYSQHLLRQDNPDVSFPSEMSDEVLAEFGVYLLVGTHPPGYDSLTQQVQQADPALVDGVWQQTWQVSELPFDVQIANLKSARSMAYSSEADPLFFKAQRGEAELSEWEAKVQEIRERYAYPAAE